ncbi:MAG: glycosyltransferase family 4 protein [Patescibacteria group bacterium]
MNILVFSWRDPKHPLAGGAEQVMHEHMKGWIAAGYQVTLFTSRAKGLSDKEVIDGVVVIRRGIQYFGVQIAGYLYYLNNNGKIDLIVDQFHGLPFFTPLYSNKPKIAVIQEVAGKVWLKNDLPKPLNWIIGIIGYLGEPLLFIFYRKTHFMTGSDSTKKQLEKVGISSKMITIIPHGVKLIDFKHLPKKETLSTIIYLGAVTMDKGIDEVLKVFNILNEKGVFNFWIVGRASEEYKKYIDKKRKEFGLLNRLKTFGFVSESKKFNLLARAHILINPSVLEGWGLVNIEANSVGTPVVAYNSPGLVDSVKTGVNGIICKKNTPGSMSASVERLLSESRNYQLLSKSAKLWSKKFSWPISKKMSLTLIDHVVRLGKV